MKTQAVLVLLAVLVAALRAEPQSAQGTLGVQDPRLVQVSPPSVHEQVARRFGPVRAFSPAPAINFGTAPIRTSAFSAGRASNSALASRSAAVATSAPLAAPAPSFFLPGPVPTAVVFAPAPAPAPAFAAAPPAPPSFVPTHAVFAPPAPELSPAPSGFAPAPAPLPAPAPAPQHAPIIPLIRRTEVHDEAGQYALGFETGNGIIVTEQGALKKNLDGEWKDDFVLVKQGSFMYPAPDGRIYKVTYTADENGFHPKGSHLPVAPTISESPSDTE